jgi:hypothetical protein
MEPQRPSKRPYNLHIGLPSQPAFTSSSGTAPDPAANFAHHEPSPPENGLKYPDYDLIFFNDPRFQFDNARCWGMSAGCARTPINNNCAHLVINFTANYRIPAAPMPRYDPAADDLQVFYEHEQRATKAEENETKSATGKIAESEQGHRVAEVARLRHVFAERAED